MTSRPAYVHLDTEDLDYLHEQFRTRAAAQSVAESPTAPTREALLAKVYLAYGSQTPATCEYNRQPRPWWRDPWITTLAAWATAFAVIAAIYILGIAP